MHFGSIAICFNSIAAHFKVPVEVQHNGGGLEPISMGARPGNHLQQNNKTYASNPTQAVILTDGSLNNDSAENYLERQNNTWAYSCEPRCSSNTDHTGAGTL